MGLRIRTNVASQDVQKNLRGVTRQQEDLYAKLSSGKRITKSADDAAGLAISTNLEAQIRGLRQAKRNASDGISLIQVAEGGLNESTNILTRLRELTIQAASDTIGDRERELLDREYQQLLQESERIAQSTTFNGRSLLKGESEYGTMDFHVGAYAGENNRISFDATETDVTNGNLGIDGTSIAEKSDARDAIAQLDEGMDKVTSYRATLGAVQSRLNSTISNLEIQTVNQDFARSRIEDVDVAENTAKIAAANVMKQAGISTLAQANNIPNGALRLIG